MVTREGLKEMEKKTTIRNPDNSRVLCRGQYGDAIKEDKRRRK